MKQLKKWMCPEDSSQGDYYRGISALQRHLNYPLYTFSFNYDLCMERLNTSDFRVEAGFDGYGRNHLWDWERFEDSDTGPNPLPEVFLYKLHGSIDWKRDEAKNLYCVEQIESVDSDQMEVIFGRYFKLETADPYLFYAYQFRRFTLRAKLIVVIGYSFSDSHINKMLMQGLRGDEALKLMLITRCENDDEVKRKKHAVAETLESKPERIFVERGTAKSFLEQEGLGEKLVECIPKPKGAPF